ncbi:MAG: S1 RNA-binding domain-containing protein [Oscillospiraceae bacterium]|nr:S1 RNA-binding domain-containing protein [Oscillospiraceae bacterium]
MSKFFPEGQIISTEKNKYNIKSISSLQDSMLNKKILEARCIVCDIDHNLIVDFGHIKGIIPKNECAIGISDGSVKDIAIISKVNKPICFRVTGFENKNNETMVTLSRKIVQEECLDNYIKNLNTGDIIDAKITHLEQFGCFVDIGCGITSLIPIDSISISRILHTKDRFKVGQEIKCIVKSKEKDGKICLTHKELLGNWEQNASKYKSGETVAGIIRSIEDYGIFVELSPNLAGLAEYKDGVKVGQMASVYIKSLIPEKMKVKLIIVDSFDENYIDYNYNYFIKDSHIDYWKYSPEYSSKIIESIF